MKELELKTENGIFSIDKEIIEKYDLKIGARSPFTRSVIVSKTGEYFSEKAEKADEVENEKELADETTESRDGVKFTTAEILDISAGVDSQV